jgi:hypothetical protein
VAMTKAVEAALEKIADHPELGGTSLGDDPARVRLRVRSRPTGARRVGGLTAKSGASRPSAQLFHRSSHLSGAEEAFEWPALECTPRRGPTFQTFRASAPTLPRRAGTRKEEMT